MSKKKNEDEGILARTLKAAMNQAVEDLGLGAYVWECNNHPGQPFPCDMCAQVSDR